MNNPLRILQTLDCHLTAPVELTLFGRAALALGYTASPAAFAATRDVDAILPLSWLAAVGVHLPIGRAYFAHRISGFFRASYFGFRNSPGSSCWPCTRRRWSAPSPARQGERE